uniref:DEK-C domain-containing protein n=1 Tax=Phaeomonas parva TaxID=124430 RepID=A0A7S1U0K3_9STRA|mmetsp:Transcript_25592/g.80115  ORF Transcript_25592/g.80115 Transcript_25592/m.80115 type:complete len:110 (+) Transcript_25592:103-432(+)
MRSIKGAKEGGKKVTASPKKKKKSVAKKRAAPKADAGPRPKKAKKAVLHIPGASIEQVRARVTAIVNSSDADEVTVKQVRAKLEDWLDADLQGHKDAIRELVMDALDSK